MANKDLGGKIDFFPVTQNKLADRNIESGGGDKVNAYGDVCKKDKSSINMVDATNFTSKDETKVDAMGTDYPTKSNSATGMRVGQSGDSFKQGDVNPMGDDAGKKSSGQSTL